MVQITILERRERMRFEKERLWIRNHIAGCVCFGVCILLVYAAHVPNIRFEDSQVFSNAAYMIVMLGMLLDIWVRE